MYTTFSIRKLDSNWFLWVKEGSVGQTYKYKTWEQVMQKINEILATWEES